MRGLILISVCILTYNRKGTVIRSLSDLMLFFPPGLTEVLIDDNGSTDGTAEWLMTWAKGQPNVNLTLHTWNMGVAGGRWRQLARAQGEKILILDSDVGVTGYNWLHRLLSELDDPDVGLVGAEGWFTDPGWGKHRAPVGYYGPVDCVSGYCQAFRRSMLNRAAIDLRFNGHGSEDDDFCFQIRSTGKLVKQLPALGLEHWVGAMWDNGTVNVGRALMRDKWGGSGLPAFEKIAHIDAKELADGHRLHHAARG